MKRVKVSNKVDNKCLASSMGCRTYNGYDINFDFKEVIQDCLSGKEVTQISANQKDGRGNIAPTTIIFLHLLWKVVEM